MSCLTLPDAELSISPDGRLPSDMHFLGVWVHNWERLLSCNHSFFVSYLRKNARLLFWVNNECMEKLIEGFREDIAEGLQAWECLFSMSRDWFIQNYQRFPELKQHFVKRPGLWFYMFRYDQKRINPRTGEVSKDLQDAWNIMDHWGIPHNKVAKVGNEFKVVADL